MNTYIPDMKALWMAENVIASLHNIYTLRGAPVRDPLRWSKYIAEALYRFGLEAEVMFASHHWPRWGNERIQEVLRGQRDLYANMNNQVLHLANQGVTINQIHNVYELPKGPAGEVVLPRLSRLAGAQCARRHPALSRLLGLQSGDADPAVAGGLGAALCRDDGRVGRRSSPAAANCTTPGEYLLAHGDREQAGAGRARTTPRPRTCSPTSSSRSATSRRTRACATASSPAPTSCAPAFRRARPPIRAAPT